MTRKVRKSTGAGERSSLTTPKRANTSWIRQPILNFVGAVLRVLIYARYSTDEQNPAQSMHGFRIADDFWRNWGSPNLKSLSSVMMEFRVSKPGGQGSMRCAPASTRGDGT
jgi:hypothetical protein